MEEPMSTPPRRWHLLIHTLPTRPLYLRARIRRLLAESGAAPIRKAVYALPASPAALDRLRQIAAEIEAGGGSAFVCEATFPDEEVERSVERGYRGELSARYRAWIADADAELRGAPISSAGRPAGVPSRPKVRRTALAGTSTARALRLARLRLRLERLRSADLIGAPGASEAEALLAHLDRQGTPARAPGRSALAGLTWVTRKGLHVDRLACAWVVRRFIDPAAEFRFVSSPEAPLGRREIGFDMPGAEITHEAGGCSVESLVRRAKIRDRAVLRVAELVHDIDIKDGRHRHPETSGFEQMLHGVIASAPRDEDRLARGIALFDTLYAAFGLGVALPAAPANPAPLVRVPPTLRRRRNPA
jgi:hypothetical protein